MTYLTGSRLALAADRLRGTEDTLEAIARHVGYGSAFALSSAFKRVYGVSPQEHRTRRRSVLPVAEPLDVTIYVAVSPDPYREWASRLPGAVVWTRTAVPGDSAPCCPTGAWTCCGPRDGSSSRGPTLARTSATHRRHPVRGRPVLPRTAPAYLGVPAHELRDRRVDLADLWSAGAVRRLTERVDAAADPAAALEALAVARRAMSIRLIHGCGALSRSCPRAILASVAEAVGWSERQLHRRARGVFGYGPKTLARILRLQRALALARDGVPLADTAVRAGFADQAHLARDVRELAGAPLGELLRR